MNRKKILKRTLAILLIVLFATFAAYFLIYPNYNKLIGPIKRLNIQESTQEFTFQLLTEISPSREKVLGVSDTTSTDQTIEESLNDVTLEEKILEDLGTKVKISSIEIEGYIYEGVDAKTMDTGFWHFPVSVFPGQKGNSVIIGHRYAKLPPNKDTFFNLDKVKAGDKIVVEQTNASYTYIVTESKVVEKNDISVLKNFNDYRITLITCTPLWTAQQRLVITAKLDKLYKNT